METLRDFSVAKKAGFKQYEIAAMFGVTRVTLSAWYHGKPIHNLAVKRADNVLRGLELALEKGELPLPKGTSLFDRVKVLSRNMLLAEQAESDT